MNTPSSKWQTSKMPLDAWEKSPLTCIGRCRCRWRVDGRCGHPLRQSISRNFKGVFFSNLEKILIFRKHLFRSVRHLMRWNCEIHWLSHLGFAPPYDIISYTEVFAPIWEDIHRLLNECIRWGLPSWIHAFNMRWISPVLMQKALCDNFIM